MALWLAMADKTERTCEEKDQNNTGAPSGFERVSIACPTYIDKHNSRPNKILSSREFNSNPGSREHKAR